jgi:cholest-4-en-3-one 26-monooxygenase
MRSSAALNPLAADAYLQGLPLDRFEELRRDSPCLKVELNEPRQLDYAWVVSRYEDVAAVLKDGDRFAVAEGTTINRFSMSSTKGGGKPTLLTMVGQDHRRVRTAMRATFTPRTVRLFADNYRGLARSLVAEAVALGRFDFVRAVSVRLPMAAICDLLGIPEEDREKVKAWGDAIASPLDDELAPSPQYMMDCVSNLWAYCWELAHERRDDPREDVISQLAPAIGTPELSEDEFLGLVSLLAVAGNETTRNNISHSAHALVMHPEVWKALADADDSVWATSVEELTRWSSPVMYFRRTAAEDIELHGQHIAKGDPVVFLLNSANFDPRAFRDPNTLNMHRDPNRHLAFGAGAHFCLGAHLARIETRIVLEEVRRQIGSIEFDGEVEYARSTHVRGVKRLPVRVIPR